MASKTNRYRIIDEPMTKSWGERFVVNPIIILFAAIFVPLFWQPPMYGRIWLPIVWLGLNGYMLGSSTLGKEVGAGILAMAAWYGVILLSVWLIGIESLGLSLEQLMPYSRTLQFAVYFLFLYLAVFYQIKSHQLFDYVHDGR